MLFSTIFGRPHALWLLAVPILLAAIFYRGNRRRSTALERFGYPDAMRELTTLRPRTRLYTQASLVVASLLLVSALAAPRWGKGEPGVVVGRDLMIVLDLSKSMLADDMRDPESKSAKERWQAAQAGIHDLIATIEQRGGHRVGLVVFAAKPWLVCPLTTDYAHFLARLDEFNPKAPPREVNPEKIEFFPSGTRIGSALIEAINRHDPRFTGFQDVLLISDGDDPATDDRDSEIEPGILLAIDKKIPIHVAGVGDPDNAVTIAFKKADGDEEILGPTRLFEAPLKEIARRTKGDYFSDGRDKPRLDQFFTTRIEPRPNRDLSDDALPQPRDRAVWFLLPAIVLLLWAWVREP
ncbi:MAG: VWA domain-containing protein [Planctomycetes bacterium]|nr:VWA domain-containing protein [Planctomycetota bacterium]